MFCCLNDPSVSVTFVPVCLSVVGGAGLSDGLPQPGDEEVLRGSAGRPHQQTDAAHPRQTAAPQNLRRAVEPAEAGAQQGMKITNTQTLKYTTI